MAVGRGLRLGNGSFAMRYRVFGRHTGLRLSELLPGAGSLARAGTPRQARRGAPDLQGRRDDLALAMKFTDNASRKAGMMTPKKRYPLWFLLLPYVGLPWLPFHGAAAF